MSNLPIFQVALTDYTEIGATWRKGPWQFLKLGLRDFKTNIQRTWPIILAFIVYLFSSAGILF